MSFEGPSVVRRGRTRLGAASAREVLVLCLGATLLLRLPFIAMPLGIDEGGYAYVAAHWGEGSGGLYGAQWVDKPPLLFALYAVALQLGGDLGVRLLGCVAALVVVAACTDAARRIAGPVAMRWTGLAATVLASSTVVQSNTVNAELPAIAFTSVAAWLVVRALSGSLAPRSQFLDAVAAGFAATCAVLVKQSFVDGFAFALGAVVALVVAAAATRSRERWAQAGRIVAGGVVGAVVVLVPFAAWAELVGPGVGAMIDALYTFRLEARAAIDGPSTAPTDRALFLFTAAALTGALSLLVVTMLGLVRIAVGRQLVVRAPEQVVARASAAGLVTMGAYGVVAVVMGGNWWMHYLIQLTPVLAMGCGVVVAAGATGVVAGGAAAGRSRVARGTRRWGAVVVVTTLVVWVATVGWSSANGIQRTSTTVGDWLRAASRPTDTALVTWGHPNVLHRSGMETPYPMSWSLPIRVRDPQLAQLRGLLLGPDAPTWLVEWRKFDGWDLDRDGRFRAVVALRYERVSSVCGKSVYRLRDVWRPEEELPATPSKAACGSDTNFSVFGTKIF